MDYLFILRLDYTNLTIEKFASTVGRIVIDLGFSPPHMCTLLICMLKMLPYRYSER